MSKIKHIPVMYKEVLEQIDQDNTILMDGTVGHAGHSKLILEKIENIQIIAVDRDPNIIKIAKENLKEYEKKVNFVQSTYAKLENILGDKRVNYILLDLGVNMEHFKDGNRGFSIKREGPLDMRFDTNQKETAEYILKNYTKEKLEEIMIKYGDFKGELLKNIVRIIIKYRHKYKTTLDLVKIFKENGILEKKIAVIFQVIRIEVNKELKQLEEFLEKFSKYLIEGGKCMIITYHSIEDRLVKNKFKELDKNGFINITKKVIFPTKEEIKKNKPSRSAKLRVIQKI